MATNNVSEGLGTAFVESHSPPRRSFWLKSRLSLVLKIASVFAFLALWTAATELGWISSVFLPSPVAVAHQASRLVQTGDLWWSILASSQRVFLGFALAALIAVPLGVLMGVWWPAKAIVDPFVSLLRPLPSITWIPLSILWLGIGESQKVAIVFMGSWIYVLLYTIESTKRVDPILISAARNLGANDLVVMREVVLPAALPGIIAGLKVTLAISWSCVISAEMVAAQNGLGALIWQAKDWGNLQMVLVGMVGISLTVLVADWGMERLERLLLPWERQRRG
ncbi:ABC transporter permease [Microvirga calopogonii]|uniref:ABC transporter permease n=1 Tax=Microvirga calopogonii TaxID=2078013 RepID=UPI001FE1D281|nr:ABC transporter permease [Microvirga calopogonii]